MTDKFYHSRRRPSRSRKAFTRFSAAISKQWTLRNITITLAVLTAFTCLNLIFAPYWLSMLHLRAPPALPRCQTLEFASHDLLHNTTSGLSYFHAFPPIPLTPNSTLTNYRLPDISDTFATYAYRNHPKCSISSLSLHKAFSPLCSDRQSFLRAFTGGGRIGFDAPFMPRDCDMRWYTTEEVCEILGRFEKVIVVGDSMMRHVVGAMNVLLRKDLGYGAVTGWNFGEEESEKCFCTHQMDVKACSIQGIYRTSDVLTHDPSSFACPHILTTSSSSSSSGERQMTSPVNLIIELMLKYPLDPTEVTRLQSLLPTTRPTRPIAFILGHGLWNDLDLAATVHWLNGVLDSIYTAAPYLRPSALPADSTNNPLAHILFVTPSAAGVLKPDQWITSQGDKALQIFEHSVRDEIYEDDGRFVGRGMEHMGTWNMSIQMDKWDGVHLNLRGNLIKAMGVVNWLGGVEVERW